MKNYDKDYGSSKFMLYILQFQKIAFYSKKKCINKKQLLLKY